LQTFEKGVITGLILRRVATRYICKKGERNRKDIKCLHDVSVLIVKRRKKKTEKKGNTAGADLRYQ